MILLAAPVFNAIILSFSTASRLLSGRLRRRWTFIMVDSSRIRKAGERAAGRAIQLPTLARSLAAMLSSIIVMCVCVCVHPLRRGGRQAGRQDARREMMIGDATKKSFLWPRSVEIIATLTCGIITCRPAAWKAYPPQGPNC